MVAVSITVLKLTNSIAGWVTKRHPNRRKLKQLLWLKKLLSPASLSPLNMLNEINI